jgi:mRNA interferase RelE/StbE
MFTVQISKHVFKQLKAIPETYQNKINEQLDLLEKTPFPPGCKKLTGMSNTYRVRVGVYRIIYEVFQKVLLIQIINISHRQDAYK